MNETRKKDQAVDDAHVAQIEIGFRMESVVEPQAHAEGRFVRGAHRPFDAGIGVVREVQNRVVEVRRAICRDWSETKAAEDLFEIVIVGDAESGRHEELPDQQRENDGAECEVDTSAVLGGREQLLYTCTCRKTGGR